MKISPFKTYAALFILSLSSFLYEIFLIRVFGVLFRSEYLFLLISLAIVGLGIGALLCHHLRECAQRETILRTIIWIHPLTFFPAYLLIFKFFATFGMTGSVAVGLIPFISSGYLISYLYAGLPEKSGLLYFCDLTGGAVGCLLSVFLAHILGVSLSLPLIGVVASVAMLILCDLPATSRAIPMVLNMAFLILSTITHPFSLGLESLKKTDTPLGQTLSYPRVKAQWIKSTWDLYSRCDLVISSRDGSRKSIFINGGTQAEMVRNITDPESLKYLKKDIIYLPYLFGKNDHVLILGAGGGRDVFMALSAGAGLVDAVEINRGVIDMVEQEKSFTGDIYGRDRVKLAVEDGRSYLMKSHDSYDRIVLSLTSTLAFSDLSALGQQENYLYTMEAFELYLDHLTPEGNLTIFIDYPELLEKFILSGIETLRTRGIDTKQAMMHIVAFTTKEWSGYRYGIMIKKSPYDIATVDKLAETIKDYDLKPIYLPYYESNTDFHRLATGVLTPEQYIENSSVHLKPSSDDNPYFLEVVLNIRAQLYLLGILICGMILAGVLGFYVNMIKRIPENISAILAIRGKYLRSRYHLLVFLLSGCAFFMVEIALTKRFSFYLGLPHLNLAVILFSILLGAGLGGMITNLMRDSLEQKLILVLSVLAVTVLGIWVTLSVFINATIHWPLTGRCAILVCYLFPLSCLLGMPFPLLIRWSNEHFREDIAWFWGINALAGVLGSILSVILAMAWGFYMTFIGAALMYLAMAGLVWLSVRESSRLQAE